MTNLTRGQRVAVTMPGVDGDVEVTGEYMGARGTHDAVILDGACEQVHFLSHLNRVRPLSAPEPPMSEPTEFGARVMTDDGLAVYYGGACPWARMDPKFPVPQWSAWSNLTNPRPVDEPALTLELDQLRAKVTELNAALVRTVAHEAELVEALDGALTLDAVLAVVDGFDCDGQGRIIEHMKGALRAKFGGTR